MPYICLTLKFGNNVGVWPVGFRHNHKYNNSKFRATKKGQSEDQRRRKARAPAKLHNVQSALVV